MENLYKHNLTIKDRQTLLDITPYIRVATKSGIKDAIVVVYCPHSTAGLLIRVQT
ncbi:MAG: hypothetical protein ACRC6T_10000 [Sarcina sp.]